jgi:hypothetical protein
MRPFLALALVVSLAACAAGRALVPGQSTAAQVEAAMGRPADKIVNAAGETVWFYPKAPAGRETLAVRMRPDGTVLAVEQRLTKENIARVVSGTTAKEVRELLGPTLKVWRNNLKQRDVWDYPVLVDNRMFNFYVQFSDDGIVREAYLLHDPFYDVGNGRS